MAKPAPIWGHVTWPMGVVTPWPFAFRTELPDSYSAIVDKDSLDMVLALWAVLQDQVEAKPYILNPEGMMEVV